MKKGISLIVLVITIIVMIVLAAAVVITLNNTGIINKASDAVDKTNLNEVQNFATLVWSDEFMANKRGETLKTDVLEKLKDYTDKYDIIVTDKGVEVIEKTGTNEYGFYYDKPYRAQMDEYMYMYLVFKSNNKAEGYMYEIMSEAGYAYGDITTAEYKDKEINITDFPKLIVEDNGKKLVGESEGETVIFECVDEEYRDIYYGVKYEYINTSEYIIFNSDNTASIYEYDGTLQRTVAATRTADNPRQILVDGKYMLVSMDAKTLSYRKGSGILQSARYNNVATNHNGTIPTGGAYIKADGTKLLAAALFPTPTAGDIYSYGDYAYVYNSVFEMVDGELMPVVDETLNGWSVIAKTNTYYTYGDIIETISNKPIVSLKLMYSNSTRMLRPATNIHKLTNVITMEDMFNTCSSLVSLPVNFNIGSNVTNVKNMFNGCTSLTGSIEVNTNPMNYEGFIAGTQITAITGSTKLKTELLNTK